MEKSRNLYVLADDEPGIMNRIAGIIARRAFNISGLTSGQGQSRHVQWIIIGVEASEDDLESLARPIRKLAGVRDVHELSAQGVARHMVLVQLSTPEVNEGSVAHIVSAYGARIVKSDDTSVVIEMTGTDPEVEEFLDAVEQLPLMHVAVSGVVALPERE
ncbi:MAG: acetolactate synthase small subunit [Actinomycetaceae bacterium]|nr:acetolactate synthase small subunit [Actinomycetaceae bacterium]MDY6083414.1 acetolactate synthase small subunit [Actinomycetaceae bacterium]